MRSIKKRKHKTRLCPTPQTQHLFTYFLYAMVFIALAAILILSASHPLLAGQLPGDDASNKLEAAGTLLKIIDTGLFKWGARIFAGLCILSGGWALKEQRFATAVICVVGAITIGTAPKWVKNIFDVGENQGLFSMSEINQNAALVLKA